MGTKIILDEILPTLKELNVVDKYMDHIFDTEEQVANSFNDKFNFLVGQVVELELYSSGTIPAIITKVNDIDENGHFSYNFIFLIGNRNISYIEEKERYLWRFTPKKFNIKRIQKFIQEINDTTTNKFEDFREDLIKLGLNYLYLIENNKVMTVGISERVEKLVLDKGN